ncbi:hypothetical protein [Natronomonas moolapensis]|nr:hypothetical protein [Natronomonas moolapensis]
MGLIGFAADGPREGPIAAGRRERLTTSVAAERRKQEVIGRGA